MNKNELPLGRCGDVNIKTMITQLGSFADSVAVASTMHEPKGSLLECISSITPLLKGAGVEWYISATEATKNTALFEHVDNNFHVRTDKQMPFASKSAPIEENHYAAIQLALENTRRRFILYIDSDRFSLGLSYFTQEATQYYQDIGKLLSDGIVCPLSRTDSAMRTHISSLVLTESPVHKFYTRHLKTNGHIVDVMSAAHIMPTSEHRKNLEGYNGGVLAGVPCAFPHSKMMLLAVQRGARIRALMSGNLLNYEYPEQARGNGDLEIQNHEFNPEGYDRLSLASRHIQESLMQNPREWKSRFINLYQYLNVLNELYLKPRGKSDFELDNVIAQARDYANNDKTLDEYRKGANELFSKHNHLR